MPILLKLSAETEQLLRDKARRSGRTLEAYLEAIANREAQGSSGGPGGAPGDANEFERGLNELSDGLPPLPTLPADFSRTDVYGDHP